MAQVNPGGDARRLWRRSALAAAALGCALALAACTDDEGGYQFANGPRPTALASPTTIVVTPPPAAATPVPAKSVAFADLIAPRGAPGRVYFRAGPDLWTIGADGADPHPVFAPVDGQRIVGSSPSPSGDRVAVLIAGPDDAASAVVLRPDGAVEMERKALGDFLPGAPADPPAPAAIDWSPQGDQLLVGFDGGGLLALSARPGSEPAPVLGRSAAPASVEAAWSPTGEEVAFLAADRPEGARSLFVAGVGAAATPQPVLPETDDRSVLAYAWMPDGRSLLFTEGMVRGGPAASADLWRVRTDGERRELVASAGAAAPVAQVARVAPSPDGAAVAYTVTVPGDAGAIFHSLWVRELATGKAYQLMIPEQQAVTDLWWTARGLMFRTVGDEREIRYEGGAFDLYLVSSPSESRLVFQAAAAATPVASPAASPVASAP